MTDNPLTLSTQIATLPQAAPNPSSASSTSARDAPTAAEQGDEEPYTIKCICDYRDDDGNTIYCETCDTWQHIECFYPGRVDDAAKAEFDHSCADCKPRPLDRRHATERQRSQRQERSSTGADKKTKRPPSTKGHRKRAKPPSDLQQVNGHGDEKHDDHPPPPPHAPSGRKKGHRASQSVSSTKRSPPYSSRPANNNTTTHAHPPSPAKTPPDLPPHVQIHSYSDYFRSLYDHHDTFVPSHTNSFASLPVTNSLSLWLHDPQRLREDAGVNDKDDVCQNLVVPIDTLKWPDLRIQRKDFTFHDERLHYRYLITPAQLNQAGRIGELNGVVGFQKDYCNDDMNRWQETAHPRPFVFFHPRLPLFIDTRQEGSTCRYVRRSCRANTVLETFIASGSEYHFWLISERPLPAHEQITIAWDFRFPSHSRARFLHLLNLGDEDGGASFDVADITEEEYEHLAAMIDQVLSDHGGCACDLGQDCAFARFHRNYFGRAASASASASASAPQTNGAKPKKGRKPKQAHVSPTSTGHATNSRAASEDDDGRSVSGSTRSKPHSRDLTPLSGIPDVNGLSMELTDREKRKIAMVEDSFRKLDQGQPPRKKKRASDGAPNASTTPQPTPKPRQKSTMSRVSVSQPSSANGSRSKQYVDAGTSGHQSVSPFNAASPTAASTPPGNAPSQRGSASNRSRQASTAPAPKSAYVDASTQTDVVEDEWYSSLITPPKQKKSIIPLAKRLLRNRQRIRDEQEAKRSSLDAQFVATSPTLSMDVDMSNPEERHGGDSPTDTRGRNPSLASPSPSGEAALVDTPMIDAPALTKPPPPWANNPNPIPTPAAAAPTPPPILKSPELRVQPPAPTFSMPNLTGTSTGSLTPASAVAQSPFGSMFPTAAASINGAGAAVPSPVKTTKKLTLSDYRARKKNLDTSGAKPSGGNSPTTTPAVLKPPTEEAKALALEGAAAVDSPAAEKPEPLTSAASTDASSPKHQHVPLEQPNGSL